MNGAITIDGGIYTPLISGLNGVSQESKDVSKLVNEIRSHNLQSQSLSRGKEALRQRVEKVYKECAQENWDGYGAQPISKGAYEEAINLIDGLPSSIPLPDVSPGPFGEISFEWYVTPRKVFEMSLWGTSSITYAGLFGYEDTHGTVYFSEAFPKIINSNIARVFA